MTFDDMLYDIWDFYEDLFDQDFYYPVVDREIPRTPYKPKTKLYIPDKRLKNHRCRNCC